LNIGNGKYQNCQQDKYFDHIIDEKMNAAPQTGCDIQAKYIFHQIPDQIGQPLHLKQLTVEPLKNSHNNFSFYVY